MPTAAAVTPAVNGNPELSPEKLEEHRRARLRRLERENRVLRAERDRMYLLLGLALQVAVGQTTVRPGVLLDIICALAGTNPAKLAADEDDERHERTRNLDRFLQALR